MGMAVTFDAGDATNLHPANDGHRPAKEMLFTNLKLWCICTKAKF